MNKREKTSLERLCRFCEYARTLQLEDQMLCEKKGVVDAGYHCRAFCYDPLKRKPGAPRNAAPLEYVPLDEA